MGSTFQNWQCLLFLVLHWRKEYVWVLDESLTQEDIWWLALALYQIIYHLIETTIIRLIDKEKKKIIINCSPKMIRSDIESKAWFSARKRDYG